MTRGPTGGFIASRSEPNRMTQAQSRHPAPDFGDPRHLLIGSVAQKFRYAHAARRCQKRPRLPGPEYTPPGSSLSQGVRVRSTRGVSGCPDGSPNSSSARLHQTPRAAVGRAGTCGDLLSGHRFRSEHVADTQQCSSSDDLTHAVGTREPIQTVDRVHEGTAYPGRTTRIDRL